MLPLGWVLGGLGVSAVAAVGKYLMDNDSNKAVVPASSLPIRTTWGKYHTMKLYLATLVFGIDGNICDAEQKALKALSVDMPEEEKNRQSFACPHHPMHLFPLVGYSRHWMMRTSKRLSMM